MESYRQMTTEQLKDLYAYAAPIWEECYSGVLTDEHIRFLTDKYFRYENLIKFSENGMIYEYIYHDGELAGFLAYEEKESFIYLDKLYLHKSFRGLHISSHTFDYLINRYKKPIRLNVNQGNKCGMRAYTGNDFKIIETTEIKLPGGFINNDYVMEKPV